MLSSLAIEHHSNASGSQAKHAPDGDKLESSGSIVRADCCLNRHQLKLLFSRRISGSKEISAKIP